MRKIPRLLVASRLPINPCLNVRQALVVFHSTYLRLPEQPLERWFCIPLAAFETGAAGIRVERNMIGCERAHERCLMVIRRIRANPGSC